MIDKNLNYNLEAVVSTAKRVNKLFIKYSHSSEDVKAAYSDCKHFLDRVIRREIIAPTEELCYSGYFSSHFDIVEHRDLYEAISELNVYLEGWGSIEEFEKYMEKIIP